MTVADYLDAWAEVSLPVSGLRPATVAMYRSMIANPLRPSLGAVRLDAFTPAQAEAWLQRLAVTPVKVQSKADRAAKLPPPAVSRATQRNAFICLTKALHTAVRDGLIESNPLTVVARPAAPKQDMPATPAGAVDDVLLPAVANLPIGPFVTFVALTGCRVGEAAGLRWSDVDLEAATATIRRSSPTADETKTGQVRTVPLLPDVVEALGVARRRQLEDRLKMGPGWRNAEGLVFVTGSGAPLSMRNARRDLKRVLEREGLPTARPFHSLRHGLASRLLERDVPLAVVSAILGHSSIRVTADVYGHVTPVMHADKLAEAMGRGNSIIAIEKG